MEWNIFEEKIDITLYLQMKELIFRCSTKEEKYKLKQENEQFELFEEKTVISAEKAYGLRYPGEMLERIGERMQIMPKQVRALGLALARTRNLLEEGMFIGNQFAVFQKKMEASLGKQDLFCLVIQYLMDEKRKKDMYEALLVYPFRDLAEMLLVLSVLPMDDQIWELLCEKINAQLGKERLISVYENSRVYFWLIQHFQFRFKNYRKKNLDAVKYLMRLPFCNVSGNTGNVKDKLLENGYQQDEILYLNYLLISEVHLPDRLLTCSITAEKLAIEICRYFLDAKTEYPAQAYELCSQLCSLYAKFAVKVNGAQGILDTLSDQVTIKTVAAFQVLYPHISGQKHLQKWKKLDMSNQKWNQIYSWLPKNEYDQCLAVTLELEENEKKVREILHHYQELTGEDYTKRFWRSYAWWDKSLFLHLCERHALKPVEMMQQFLTEYRKDAQAAYEKWKQIGQYLQDYMEHLQTHEAYAMLELLIEEAGISDEWKPFRVTKVLESCVQAVRGYWNSDTNWQLDIIRPFLETEEHQKLFLWIEEYFFLHHTKDHRKFLVRVLLQEENLLWLSKEDARAIYLELTEEELAKRYADKLRGLYLAKTEREKLENHEKFLRERRKLTEQWMESKRLKKCFNEIVSKSRMQKGQFKAIRKFLFSYSYRKNHEAEDIAASYIRSLFSKEQILLYSEDDLEELTELLIQLYKRKKLNLYHIKAYISKVEVAA